MLLPGLWDGAAKSSSNDNRRNSNMVDSPRVGAGDVEITLLTSDGQPERLVLTPSYNAARTISAASGGIGGAIDRVLKLDIDTVVSVITLGLGYGQTRRGPKDLAERIWRTGLTDDSGGLIERCVLYLRVLASGGQMPKDMEASQDNENPPEN